MWGANEMAPCPGFFLNGHCLCVERIRTREAITLARMGNGILVGVDRLPQKQSVTWAFEHQKALAWAVLRASEYC